MTALSIMDLIPKPPARIVGGRILFEGTDLVQLPDDRMRDYRGSEISMIFQEPMTSLNPVMLCGKQIAEGLLVHNPDMAKAEAEGARFLYRDLALNTFSVLNATESFLEEDPETAQTVLDTYERARAWALEHPDETVG
ncbi:ABC transporter substrate-binding protein, partial [Enterococcus faecalis]|nr:ABC transporter substrate-binding protein [Enterococcus faecalis]